jgi:ribonuclease HI
MENNTTLNNSTIIIYTDGGSRGNPGHAGAGGVIYSNEKIIAEISKYLGIQTNNYAEYTALLLTLERAKELNINKNTIHVFMDSKLVVCQLNGTWKVKHPNIIPIYNKIKDLLVDFEDITFTHVYRNNNKYADSLVNKAIDGFIL